jgi:hypothetical protein
LSKEQEKEEELTMIEDKRGGQIMDGIEIIRNGIQKQGMGSR